MDGTRACDGTRVLNRSGSALVMTGSASCATGGIGARWFSGGGAVRGCAGQGCTHGWGVWRVGQEGNTVEHH